MLVSFIDSTNKGLNEMQESVKNRNLKQVSELAHKMLPPCRHIGAMELYTMLKKLEENIQVKMDQESMEKLMAESLKEFAAINTLITGHITKIS
jgi:HPt (histidine-containing phosphotransfer) domain-containing protein